MTHDELLAKIDAEGEFLVQHFDCKPVFISALRAVVELHKPTSNDWDTILRCAKCRYEDGRRFPYPCQTIQAIEKELI